MTKENEMTKPMGYKMTKKKKRVFVGYCENLKYLAWNPRECYLNIPYIYDSESSGFNKKVRITVEEI